MYLPKVFFIGFSFLFFAAALFSQSTEQIISFELSGYKNAQSVVVVGTLNDWNKSQDSLIYNDSENKWKLLKELPFGKYEYRFVINREKYIRDPANPHYGGDFSNSLLYVDPPTKPSFSILAPKSGQIITQFPMEIRIMVNPGSETDKIDKKKTRLLINEQPIKFDHKRKEQLVISKLNVLKDGIHTLKVFLTDNEDNSAHPESLIFVVNSKNMSPVAEAGYTQFASPGDTLQLNGGLSYDPDYDTFKKIEWELLNQTDQPVFADTQRNLFPKIFLPDTGTYLFTLRVNDGKEWSNTDTTEVISRFFKKDSAYFQFTQSDFPDIDVKSLGIAGEFNEWSSSKTGRKKTDSGWDISIPILPGKYEYKLVLNDSIWVSDPSNSATISDGKGKYNSVLTVDLGQEQQAKLDFSADDGYLFFSHSGSGKTSNIRYYQDVNNPHRKAHQSFSGNSYRYLNRDPGASFYYPIDESKENPILQQTFLINNQGFNQIQIQEFNDTPGWAKDAIIYLIYVRKFSKDPQRDGTLRDIIGGLDYLKTLGVSCLWLMPVMESSTVHGYTPIDFFSIEKDYGSLEDYQELIREVHKRDMRIIFDFIVNHTSDQHPFFLSAWWNRNSVFYDWYKWRGIKDYEYHYSWDQLPNLNFRNPNVRNYMLKVAEFWVNQGIDGLRCDMAWAVPHSFWKEFRRKMKVINPDLLLINEAFPRKQAYHQYEFDMSYDTDFYGGILDFFKGKKRLSDLQFYINKHQNNYPPKALAMRYLENQDLPRFIEQFGEGKTRVSAALLFTLPGTPLVYYGQEFGVTEQRPGMKLENQDNPIFRLYKKLLWLRRDNPVLRRDSLEFLENDSPDQVLTFFRQDAGKKLMIVLNMSNNSIEVSIPNNKLSSNDLVFSFPKRMDSMLSWPLQLQRYEIQIWKIL
jgi:glycosidase